MNQENIYIEIIGDDADECAKILSQTIHSEFGTRPVTFNPNEQSASEGAGKKLEPASIGAVAGVVSVVLALPSAVLAAMQIKERLSKKQSFERVVEKGKQLKKTKRISRIRLRAGKLELDMESADYAEVSDEAHRYS